MSCSICVSCARAYIGACAVVCCFGGRGRAPVSCPTDVAAPPSLIVATEVSLLLSWLVFQLVGVPAALSDVALPCPIVATEMSRLVFPGSCPDWFLCWFVSQLVVVVGLCPGWLVSRLVGVLFFCHVLCSYFPFAYYYYLSFL